MLSHHMHTTLPPPRHGLLTSLPLHHHPHLWKLISHPALLIHSAAGTLVLVCLEVTCLPNPSPGYLHLLCSLSGMLFPYLSPWLAPSFSLDLCSNVIVLLRRSSLTPLLPMYPGHALISSPNTHHHLTYLLACLLTIWLPALDGEYYQGKQFPHFAISLVEWSKAMKI